MKISAICLGTMLSVSAVASARPASAPNCAARFQQLQATGEQMEKCFESNCPSLEKLRALYSQQSDSYFYDCEKDAPLEGDHPVQEE